MKMQAMKDELVKIAASKARVGKIGIKAANLAARSKVDKTNSQLKTAGAASVATKGGKKLLSTPAKIGLTGAGTVAAWETGKQALRDYQLGRAVRKQQERRG